MPRLNADDWLDILSNKHRRRILRLCSMRPCYAQEIAKLLNLTPAAVIKHLQVLEERNLVVKREEVRSEGGRNIQYYFAPFRPRFDFNLASNDLVEIDIEDESDKSVPEAHSRDKLLVRENFTEDAIHSIKQNYKTLIELEKEKREAFRKLRMIQKEEEHFFRAIQSQNDSQSRILFRIIRFLLDRYGHGDSFTHNDLMYGLGLDLASVEEIIQLLASDLQIITKSDSDSESTLPEWKLTEQLMGLRGHHKHDYI